MPHGFFTIEQWIAGGSKPHWKPVLHLDSHQSLTKAVKELEKLGQPGLYRVTQTQRCVWAEIRDGKLRVSGSHVSSPAALAKMCEIFEKENGVRPIEKARQERARAKRARLR